MEHELEGLSILFLLKIAAVMAENLRTIDTHVIDGLDDAIERC